MGKDLELLARQILLIRSRFNELIKKMANHPRIEESEETDDWEQLIHLCFEYVELKKKIRFAFLDPKYSVIGVENEETRNTIIGILKNEPTEIEKALAKLLENKMSQKEINELLGYKINVDPLGDEAMEYLFEWFGPSDYIEGIYELGALIMEAEKIPSFLNEYVSEIRCAYGFGQYLSVIALSRAMLEICVYDIIQKKWAQEHDGKAPPVAELRDRESLSSKIKELLKENPELSKRATKDLLRKMNPVIHGDLYPLEVTRQVASDTFKETLDVIYKIYEFLF